MTVVVIMVVEEMRRMKGSTAAFKTKCLALIAEVAATGKAIGRPASEPASAPIRPTAAALEYLPSSLRLWSARFAAAP